MQFHTFLLRPLIALAVLLVVATAAHAQSEKGQTLPPPLSGWDKDLKRIEETVKKNDQSDEGFLKLREELEAIREKAGEFAQKTQADHAAAKSQLDKMGPPPKEEEPAESEAASKLRDELNKKVAELDGIIRAAQVLQTRAGQISGSIQDERRRLFSRELFKKVQSPLTPAPWYGVFEYGRSSGASAAAFFKEWWQGFVDPWELSLLGIAAVLSWALLFFFSRKLTARFRTYEGEMPPPFLRRAASAGGATLTRALPLVVAATVFFGGLWLFDMLSGQMEPLIKTAYTAFCAVTVLWAMIRAVLAPNRADWRVIHTSNTSARRLCRLATAVVMIHGIDLVLGQLSSILDAPLPLTVTQSFFATVLVAICLAVMLRVPLRATSQLSEAESPHRFTRTILRGILWICVFGMLAGASLGYIAFARFLMNHVVLTASILILFYLLHIAIEDFGNSLSNPARPTGQWLERNFDFDPQRHVHFGLAASLFLHILLLTIFIPILLLQWGFDWEDIRVWGSKALFGFEVGQWTISLATILGALLLFILGLLATRLFQRWLDSKVLERAQFEQGARSAIRTGLGYVGFALAALLAVSYAGLDFSNLAIVAGALSVGIGFGLQSIVNNFVSGLILLAERRVSVGDWIVVGNEEGYVRRISVRATEIETFDRNFVIIPNAELMSNPVKNWTFQHRRARVVIEVGVGYGSDPEQVQKIMTECANDHPLTIDAQKTRVFFENFGESALLFRLRTFVGDVSDKLSVQSELNTIILRRFREAGIEIPYPQRDIHLKGNAVVPKPAARKPAARKPAAARKPKSASKSKSAVPRAK